jgi:tetratricopeptide (TPR) repeat protein
MIRRALLYLLVPLLLAGESAYFGRQVMGSIERIRGERAFFENDHVAAWKAYRASVAWGGNVDRAETDMLELLLFGLDQREANVRVELPLDLERAIETAGALAVRRILETPYRAYNWSLASDVSFHAAHRRRDAETIDLESLSENPLENLLPEDRLGVAALHRAAIQEPNNYIYLDLMAQYFLDIGAVESAAPYTRRAVAAYPVLDGHQYLLEPDVPEEVLAAAGAGFDDALRQASLIAPASIDLDAGRLLASHGKDREGLEHFRSSLERGGEFHDAEVQMGYALYRLGDYREAIVHLERGTGLLPEQPWPWLFLGRSRQSLGDLKGAITAFRSAHERGPGEVRFSNALGEALEASGDLRGAERQFQVTGRSSPKDPAAWSALLGFYLRHDDARGIADACARLAVLGGELPDRCRARAAGVR